MSEEDNGTLVLAIIASLAAWLLGSGAGLLIANLNWGLRTPNGDLLWEAFIFSTLLGLVPVVVFWTNWIVHWWSTNDE